MMTNICDKLSPEDIEELIRDADFNENGEINYEKLVKSKLKK